MRLGAEALNNVAPSGKAEKDQFHGRSLHLVHKNFGTLMAGGSSAKLCCDGVFHGFSYPLRNLHLVSEDYLS
jgi:hypothetical protein